MHTEQLIELVQTTLDDIKARDVILLDVRGKSSVTDYMIIASGSSNRHVKSAADAVSVAVKKAGVTPLGIEGMDTGEWALVDLVDVVVHVMQTHVRDLYDLEGLWGPDAVPSDEVGTKTGEPTRG
ncbi:MAG: ribosome-associated protein [Motiliproteus sp.]|jgi:ribosome-associated protein